MQKPRLLPGRAAQLHNDVGFVDSRFQGLLILRPMKDFTPVELFHYLRHFDLAPVVPSKKSAEMADADSIQNMTRKFVADLNDKFPATVSTVFRVSEKMAGDSKSAAACAFCAGAIDREVEEGVSAMAATQFSREISNARKCGENGAMRGVLEGLCYGCRLIYRDVGGVEEVPEFARMRREVEEYLL